MEIKDIIQKKEESEESTPVYMPSSSEKKRAVLMYLFIGIVVYLSKKDINVFEYYHLKQASWRRILFLFVLVLSAVLLFLPVIKIIWALLLIAFVATWGIWVKQAWDWKYSTWSNTSFMDLFSSVWNRFLDLFEINIKTINPDGDTKNTDNTDNKSTDIIDDVIQQDLDKKDKN